MEKIRFGIIGAGNMGRAHFYNFMGGKIINGYVSAIADLKPEKLDGIKAIAAEHPEESAHVQYFGSGDELIAAKCCDVVIIAIPHYFHPEYAIKALRNGMNAIVEKPAGVYTLQVEEMLEEAKKYPNLKLGIMFNQRTNPAFKKMKQMIADGELGKITRLNWIITDWYRTQSYYDGGGWRATWKGEGGGVLFNQAPHNIDLFQWIPDMMPKKVRAFCSFGKYHNIEVEDDVTAYFEYENGATGVFITTTGDAPGTNRFEVTGELGKLVFDEGKVTFWKNEMPTSEHIKTEPASFSKPKAEVIEVDTTGDNPQHAGILNNFANTLLGLEELYAPASDGIKGVQLADAMLMSAWTNEAVDIPFDGKKYYELLQEHIKNSTVSKDENASAVSSDFSSSYKK